MADETRANESRTPVRPTFDRETVPPRWVTTVLAGAVFPLTRAQLLQVARENGATQTQLTLLHRLGERRYDSADEAESALVASTS